MKPYILVCTPTHDETVSVATEKSMLAMQRHFLGRGINLEFFRYHSNGLFTARNVMANMVLRDKACTHLLFFDSDIGCEPTLIDKMLGFDKPMVGAAAPRRRANPDSTIEPNADRTAPDSPAVRFYFAPVEGAKQQGDFIQTRTAGTGILLVRRDVLEKFTTTFQNWTRGPVPSYQQIGLDGPIFQFFCELRDENNFAVGEDVGFTIRWTHFCGGELWVCVSETITHTGKFNYVGNWAAANRARERVT